MKKVFVICLVFVMLVCFSGCKSSLVETTLVETTWDGIYLDALGSRTLTLDSNGSCQLDEGRLSRYCGTWEKEGEYIYLDITEHFYEVPVGPNDVMTEKSKSISERKSFLIKDVKTLFYMQGNALFEKIN